MPRMDVLDELKNYNAAKSIRSPRENDFRLASQYCLPEHYGAWQTEGPAQIGTNSTPRRMVFDSTAMRSLPKYASVLQRLATPDGVRYQVLTPSANAKYLMRSIHVRRYFDDLTNLLFKFRQATRARFTIATGEMYSGLGAYGTGPIYIGKRTPNAAYRDPAIIYKSCMLRDIFILVNDDDEIVAVFRRFFLNARMFKIKFPGMEMPRCFVGKENDENTMCEFVHVVRVRDDHDPEAIDSRRHPISGQYINVKDQQYVDEGHGYANFPYLTPRTFTTSGDPYGFSPASRVISAMGGASQTKKTVIKQGQKAVDPVLLAYDDGVISGERDLRPGAVNYGGLDAQGRELLKVLKGGDFRVSELLLDGDRKDIEDSFFVTLFQILNETPEMTATEVIERVAEKTALLSPTMGRLQSEFLGPGTERELGLLDEMGLLPALPPELIEAKGEYEIQYTSPMAKGIHAEESAGFLRVAELALNVAGQTGDPSSLDHLDFDIAIPEIADYQGVPARWIRDDKAVVVLRENRAKQMQEQAAIQNASGLAQAARAANEIDQSQKGAGGSRRAL